MVYLSCGLGESVLFSETLDRYETGIKVNNGNNLVVKNKCPTSWGGHYWDLEQKEIFMGLLDEDGSGKEYASEVLEKQKDLDSLINAVKKNEETRRLEKKDLIKEIDAYLEKHYRENISLKQLGEIFHLNNVYLGQLFKSRHDMLFKDYVYFLRIRDAEEMLLNTDKRIYEIAEELGFSNADVFISRFVQLKGVTPNHAYLSGFLAEKYDENDEKNYLIFVSGRTDRCVGLSAAEAKEKRGENFFGTFCSDGTRGL